MRPSKLTPNFVRLRIQKPPTVTSGIPMLRIAETASIRMPQFTALRIGGVVCQCIPEWTLPPASPGRLREFCSFAARHEGICSPAVVIINARHTEWGGPDSRKDIGPDADKPRTKFQGNFVRGFGTEARLYFWQFLLSIPASLFAQCGCANPDSYFRAVPPWIKASFICLWQIRDSASRPRV
jgi:hypothetical protein